MKKQKLAETLVAVLPVEDANAPLLLDLPAAFEAVDEVTTALARLCQALERRQDIDPQKRAVLVPVSLATGEYRDRLYALLGRMDREGFFGNDSSREAAKH